MVMKNFPPRSLKFIGRFNKFSHLFQSLSLSLSPNCMFSETRQKRLRLFPPKHTKIQLLFSNQRMINQFRFIACTNLIQKRSEESKATERKAHFQIANDIGLLEKEKRGEVKVK